MNKLEQVAGIIAVFALSACVGEIEAPTFEEELTALSSTNSDLRITRAATAAYNDVAVAEQDGYGNSGLPCFEGQGFHWLNADYLGSADPATPAGLMYDEQDDGSLKLVGVEWIIPVDLDNLEPAPSLFGETFHGPVVIPEVPFAFYALHAWVWEHNPDGMFADGSPNISCD